MVVIDSLCNPIYSSFYIIGLYELFGEKNVCFSSEPFIGLTKRSLNLNFVIYEKGTTKKISIDYNDSNVLSDTELYSWCDIYGKVNTNWEVTPKKQYSKIVSLAPSFGIRIWSIYKTLFHAFKNIDVLSFKFNVSMYRKHLGKYRRMFVRCPYNRYTLNNDVSVNYIFHLSTLWYSNNYNKNDEEVNARRARFIRVCKLMPLTFEGGFASQGSHRSSEVLFNDCLFDKSLSMKKWLEKTKSSMIVYNTPSFWNCHGWKLGEYLALGKAILSTKVSNDLPAPLIHGEHIHFVDDNEASIQEAIQYLIDNPEYRKKLEFGARTWWETYGTPMKSLELLGLKNGVKKSSELF